MSCFAFKNVLLFVLIILILHVPLKNALLEYGISPSAGGAAAAVPTVPTTRGSDAVAASSVGANDPSKHSYASAGGEPQSDQRRLRAEAMLSEVQRRSEEEEMMRYVQVPPETTPSLNASWMAHRMPAVSPTAHSPAAMAAPAAPAPAHAPQ